MVMSGLEPGSLLQRQCSEGNVNGSGRHYVVEREDTVGSRTSEDLSPSTAKLPTLSYTERLARLTYISGLMSPVEAVSALVIKPLRSL